MGAVAHSFLYQEVIVNNAEALAYFLRTLDENQTLGQKVKRLVFEIPCSLHDEYYQKPNVAILKTRPNFKRIQEAADSVSDFDDYQSECALLKQSWSEAGWHDRPDKSFRQWAWEKEGVVFNLMQFEILLRTNNLESLCFGMIPPGGIRFVPAYLELIDLLWDRAREDRESIVPFMSKLTSLQLLRGNKDNHEPYPPSFFENFLSITSLRTLKSFGDDGEWIDFDPHFTRSEETLGKSSRHIPSFARLERSSQHYTIKPQAWASIADLCLRQLWIGNARASHALISNEAIADR